MPQPTELWEIMAIPNRSGKRMVLEQVGNGLKRSVDALGVMEKQLSLSTPQLSARIRRAQVSLGTAFNEIKELYRQIEAANRQEEPYETEEADQVKKP
jgi:hypothetical protein